nr:MAG TPA: hypothetical protein [Caudoviricetes sp.]
MEGAAVGFFWIFSFINQLIEKKKGNSHDG